MGKIRTHKDLDVWNKAMDVTFDLYMLTRDFPKEELYGLTSQIRRSCVSIPANIVEGCGREGNAELGRFLQISFGSANELEYHLMLAHDLNLITDVEYQNLDIQLKEVKRMLSTLIKRTRGSSQQL